MKRSILLGSTLACVALLVGCSGDHNDGTAANLIPADTKAGAAGGTTTTPTGAEAFASTTDGGVSAQPSGSSFVMAKTCAKTVCVQKTEAADAACESCLSAVGSNLDACTSFCDSTPSCTADDRATCAEFAFIAHVSAAIDPELMTACTGMHAQETQCTVDPSSPMAGESYAFECSAEARSMTSALTTLLQCEAKQTCDIWKANAVEAACELPPPSTLGDQMCAGAARLCGDDQMWSRCTGEYNQTDSLNRIGSFLSKDASDALLSCLSNSCSDINPCYEAWATAALGDLFGDE